MQNHAILPQRPYNMLDIRKHALIIIKIIRKTKACCRCFRVGESFKMEKQDRWNF